MVLVPEVEGMTCQITLLPVTTNRGGSQFLLAFQRVEEVPVIAPPEKGAA